MSNFTKTIHPIVIHILVWIIFLATSISQIYFRIGIIPYDLFIRSLLLIVAFYINYCLFVPNLLLRKKIYLYLAVVIAFSFFLVFIIEGLIPKPFEFSKLPPIDNLPEKFNKKPPFFELDKKPSLFESVFKGFFPSGSLFLLMFALSTSVRLGIEWYKTEKQRAKIEAQKMNSELSFLKAQLNPHFLFNSLNSIYSLANKQSKDTTNAIVILSELMRYMIYETTKELVPLQKEIDYIKNYVSLQLLRLKDSSGVSINVSGNTDYKIEPLLLISFIENAFKYGTDFKGNTIVSIKISIKNGILNLNVYNIVSTLKQKNENSGVGLENIKNRLNLLYPDNHSLEIHNNKKSFEVNLTIKLKEQ